MADELLVDKLMKFGLSRQESVIYLCLYQNGALTGYETAKLTGISRSNVYSAIAGLVEKGAAHLLDGTASKYVTVRLDEYTEDYLHHLEEDRTDLLKNAPSPVISQEGYLTISSYRHILDKMHHMFEETEYRGYISAPEEIISLFAEDIAVLIQKGLKFVIISDGFDKIKKKLLLHLSESQFNTIIFYCAEKKTTQLRLIIDSKYVLTGELTGLRSDTALYSAQPNFVNVFKEALHNEIELIRIKNAKENGGKETS